METSLKEDKRIYTMSKERPVKAVLSMGLPLTCAMFIMVLYNLVDTFFVGMLGDDNALAAVNLAYPIMMVMIAAGNMVGTGASSYIARCLGAGETRKASHTLTSGIELTIALSVLIAGAGLLFLTPLVYALGADADTFAYTWDYAQVLLIGTFFTIGNYTFGQLLRSEGSVRQSIVGMIVGTVLNIVLDPVFIFTLNLKVQGAAIATILGNAAGTLIALSFYARKKTLLSPAINLLLPKAQILKEIFWVGIPATLETLLTSVAYVILNNLASAYGSLTVAAMGVSQKLMSFGSFLYQGFAAGLSPLMGYNYGAKNYPRMLSLLKAAVIVTTGIELSVMAVFAIFAPQLVGIFANTPETIATGAIVLRANMFILPFVGATAASRASFQAMGKPIYAFSITVIRQLILYVPLLLLFNHLWGFSGLIWAQPLTEAVMMTISLFILTGYIRRQIRVNTNL